MRSCSAPCRSPCRPFCTEKDARCNPDERWGNTTVGRRAEKVGQTLATMFTMLNMLLLYVARN